jgi:hypothetical protein
LRTPSFPFQNRDAGLASPFLQEKQSLQMEYALRNYACRIDLKKRLDQLKTGTREIGDLCG